MRSASRAGLLVFAVVIYAVSSFSFVGARHRVLVAADRPSHIEPPCQVDVVTANGDRGVRIPAGVGRGWCGEAGGSAEFTFYTPASASYTMWALALWAGACNNAVYVQLDNGEKVILGNDPLYDQWHWVRGVAWSLARGTHTVRLSNHSDSVALQQIMFLSDPLELPTGSTQASYDIFYDGFDGCDGGNITAWTRDSAWQLAQPAGARDFDHRWLEGIPDSQENAGTAFACVGDRAWRDYALNVSLKASGPGLVGICLNWHGPSDYTALRWRPSDIERGASAKQELVRVHQGREQHVGAFRAELAPDRWIRVDLATHDGQLQLRVGDAAVESVVLGETLAGPFGFLVDGGRLCVDDVHVRCSGAPVSAPTSDQRPN